MNLLPIALLFGAAAVVLVFYASRRIISRIRSREILLVTDIAVITAALFLPTVLVSGIVSIWAALGHSQASKDFATLVCIVILLAAVVLPAVGLSCYRGFQRRCPDLYRAASSADPLAEMKTRTAEVVKRPVVMWTVGLSLGIALALFGWLHGRNRLLLAASRSGLSGVVRILVIAGADPDCSDPYGWPLEYAVLKRDRRLIAFLMEHGADPDAHTLRDTTSLLHFSAKTGDIATVRLILERAGKGVDARDVNGRTALIGACLGGQMDPVRWLIGEGADPNAADTQGFTPLMAAVFGGHAGVAAFLIERGADPNARDRYGVTAIQLALQAENEELIRILAGGNPHDDTAH